MLCLLGQLKWCSVIIWHKFVSSQVYLVLCFALFTVTNLFDSLQSESLLMATDSTLEVWLKGSTEALVRLSNSFGNPLPHLSNIKLGGFVSNHFCNFPKPKVWHSHLLHVIIGQLWGEKGVFILGIPISHFMWTTKCNTMNVFQERKCGLSSPYLNSILSLYLYDNRLVTMPSHSQGVRYGSLVSGPLVLSMVL